MNILTTTIFFSHLNTKTKGKVHRVEAMNKSMEDVVMGCVSEWQWTLHLVALDDMNFTQDDGE